MSMRAIVFALVGLLSVTGGAARVPAAEVSNVSFSQRAGTGIVDIRYDLTGELVDGEEVVVHYSLDGGADGFPGRAWHLSGDVGPEVAPGTGKQIVWHASRDGLEIDTANAIVRVCVQPDPLMTITLPGGVTMDFVLCPAGSFQMGANDPGWSDSDEQPVHTVTFARGFYIGTYEVTQGQWMAFDVETPFHSDYPVRFVSWNDCQRFIAKLNDHVTSTGQGPATFRLPSEAEWEYACRAGTTTRFSFGDSTCSSDWNCYPCDLSNYAWWCGNAGNKLHPVGQNLPNPWGLYDMHGNVCEWCEDWWNDTYNGAPTDGSAWTQGNSSSRLIRGGHGGVDARGCRSSNRSRYDPTGTYNNVGFRLSRTQ